MKNVIYQCADATNRCRAIVKGRPVNEGDGLGMKVPCELVFHGQRRFINILREQLAMY